MTLTFQNISVSLFLSEEAAAAGSGFVENPQGWDILDLFARLTCRGHAGSLVLTLSHLGPNLGGWGHGLWNQPSGLFETLPAFPSI